MDELARFVDKQANPSLVESVLTHLDVCNECRVLLAAITRTSEQPTDPIANPAFPRTFSVGTVVGERYRIDRLISRGGMGEVYQAWDLHLHEVIALKTIACPALDDASLYVRIRKEVQLARKVTNSNVCRILEFGLHRQMNRKQEEVIPFFTMELLDGETLADYLARHKRLSLAAFLHIASQILRGTAAIHEEGIVHRDLKPENIFLLGQSADTFRVVVMDFGLASLQDNRGSAFDSSVGSAVGTPNYMAPEQSLGGIPNVKWDIFALGVLFFRAIGGQFPFKGKTTVALAMARIREQAPLLSSIVPDVDPHVEAVIARCLERDPAQRFNSVDEIQHALGEVHAGRAPWKRSRTRPILGLVLAALAIASAIALFVSRPHVVNHFGVRSDVSSPLETRFEHASSRLLAVPEAKQSAGGGSSAQGPLSDGPGRVDEPSAPASIAHRKPLVRTADSNSSRLAPTLAVTRPASEPVSASRTRGTPSSGAGADIPRALGENEIVVPAFAKAAREKPTSGVP